MVVRYQQFVSKALSIAVVALATMLPPAHAQDGTTGVAVPGDGLDGAPVTESAPVAAVVRGIAADDLLNVRATASPIGLVLARIPNGSELTRFECAEVRGYEWCRVELPGLEGLVGWTPARYLRVALPEGGPVADVPKPLPRPAPIDATKITVGIMPDPLPVPDDPLAEAPPATIAADSDAPLIVTAQNPADEARKVDGAAADLALALATRADPAKAEVYSGGDAVVEEAEETAAFIPVPTPRPRRPGEPEPEAALTVAALDAGEDATAETPAPALLIEEPAAPASADGTSAPAAVPAQISAPSPSAPSPSAEEATAQTIETEPAAPTAPVAKAETAVSTAAERAEPPAAPPAPVASLPTTAEASVPAPADAVRAPAPQESSSAPETEPTWREQIVALLPAWGRGGGASAEAAEAEPARAIPAPRAPTTVAEPAATPPPPGAESMAERAIEVAQASASAGPAAANVTEVPCARYVGQPMTRCEARVDRLTPDDADVTILWPDGGTRVVRFRQGRPESANSRAEFRFVREAELNLIRIGPGERFEILDGLLYAE